MDGYAGTIVAGYDAELAAGRGGPAATRTVVSRMWFNLLAVLKGLYLKGLPVGEVARALVPLAVIAAVTLSAASWLFRRRME